VLDLQLMWTYTLASEMEMRMGIKDIAALYKAEAAKLKRTIQKKYWDNRKRLYADTEQKDIFSQHANALAILSGMIKGTAAHDVARKIMIDTSIAKASIYFKYYLYQALVKAGEGNNYLNWLDIWKENIRMGLTTWAEISEISFARSDCHAWGASPNIEFFRTVLGIDSDAPAFRKVKIEPHLGNLKHANGEIPHPAGKVTASYTLNGSLWDVKINLPSGVNGKFIWKRKTYPLKAGSNVFKL
jgi:alpha-L-rhamnosidase